MSGSDRLISGSTIRDLLLCERRADLDLNGDPAARDPVSPFVQMLWSEGMAHEGRVLASLPGPVTDLRGLDRAEREKGTVHAIAAGAPTILGAVLRHGDLIGMPDLLRMTPHGHAAADVKSGAATSGPKGAYRREYLVQVAHYAHILDQTGLGRGDVATIVDRSGTEFEYDLTLPLGRDHTPGVDLHAGLLARARTVIDGGAGTRPALSATCGMCHWRSVCRMELRKIDDLTLVAGLGRSLRGPIEALASTVAGLARIDAAAAGRLKGVGQERLARFAKRAALLSDPTAGPVAHAPVDLPRHAGEIDFDVEADPIRGLVYLHGFWHATEGGGRFVHFFAETPDEAGERAAFAEAMGHFRTHRDEHWYHYSAYERTAYRDLQRRHPDVCGPEEIEAVFATERCTDLYTTVSRATDWPLSSYGIKSIARACGFEWEDADPGGANSIEWFDRWVTTRDPVLRDRIVAYNRDDVKASARVREALRELEASGVIEGFRRP